MNFLKNAIICLLTLPLMGSAADFKLTAANSIYVKMLEEKRNEILKTVDEIKADKYEKSLRIFSENQSGKGMIVELVAEDF